MTSDVDPRDDLVLPLWRALVVFRIVTWGFAVVALYLRRDEVEHLSGAVAVLGAMAAWTVVVTVAYSRDWGRNWRFAAIDLAVTLGCMAATVLAYPLERIQDGASILTSVWAAGPTLALAVAAGFTGGLIGAGVTSLALLGLRLRFTTVEVNNIQLLVVAGLVVGYAATTTRRAQARLREAIAGQAAAEERERLARSIHDGVLQVLAHVKRRGTALGGEAADLGALAGEQEVALRSLITRRAAVADGRADLCSALTGLQTTTVEVIFPAQAVPLDSHTTNELRAVAAEALANVRQHAGPDARAWVVVEDLGDAVVVSIRDDGVGIEPHRLDRAARDGHLGVAQSIRGRVRDLDGPIELHTAPGEGTEWEITIDKANRR
ncbi:MAG: MacS family sensor histidine kinase [Nocardioidaceae bacterium]